MECQKLNEFTDDRLFSLIKEGNQLAFQQIYHRYWEGLYSSAINILKDKGATEDVLHEVFMNIWTKRDRIEVKNLKGYLYRAVRNHTLMKIRNQRFLDLNEAKIHQMVFTPAAEKNLAYADLKNKIELSMKVLPSRCKEIFFMSRFQEYSIKEIARHFDISHRTVENQLHIALKHLRGTLHKILTLLLIFSFC